MDFRLPKGPPHVDGHDIHPKKRNHKKEEAEDAQGFATSSNYFEMRLNDHQQ